MLVPYVSDPDFKLFVGDAREVLAGLPAESVDCCVTSETVGWSDCGHDAWRTGVVLDPFLGSGTTALVARQLGRHAVGVELSPAYAELAARRLQQLSLLA